MSETPQNQEQEKRLDPRVESLAGPLARDYAEKNYPKIGEDEDGKSIFEPAWRGANGEKDLRGKSPEDIAKDLVANGWTQESASAVAATSVVDIANASYDEFSDYWKEQNRGGAEYLISLLDENGSDTLRGLDLSDPEVRSEFGALVHDNWISRNEWVKHPEWGNPDLAKPFDGLSVEEQQKDVDQLGVLQDWLNGQILDEFGYSKEEIADCREMLTLQKEVGTRLVEENPEQYDPRLGKDEAINRQVASEEIVAEALGKPFNSRRVYGYDDIVSGRPRFSWAGRFKE